MLWGKNRHFNYNYISIQDAGAQTYVCIFSEVHTSFFLPDLNNLGNWLLTIIWLPKWNKVLCTKASTINKELYNIFEKTKTKKNLWLIFIVRHYFFIPMDFGVKKMNSLTQSNSPKNCPFKLWSRWENLSKFPTCHWKLPQPLECKQSGERQVLLCVSRRQGCFIGKWSVAQNQKESSKPFKPWSEHPRCLPLVPSQIQTGHGDYMDSTSSPAPVSALFSTSPLPLWQFLPSTQLHTKIFPQYFQNCQESKIA